MKQVEFRLLQLVISHVSGDKQTLALLHWDGVTLRVAGAAGALGVVEPVHRDAVRATAQAWIRRARHAASLLGSNLEPSDRSLADVFPVRAGLGAALLWTPVTTFQVGDAAAHFDALVRELVLDREALSVDDGAADSCPPDHGVCSPSMFAAAGAHAAPATAASCRG
jgi:hypothetical protein